MLAVVGIITNKEVGMIKKRQHYVWQRYLKNWSKDNKRIYRLRDDEIKLIGTRRAAVEKYFYKLGDLSQDDLDCVEKGYVDHMKCIAGEQARKILLTFRELVKQKELLKESFPDSDELDKDLDIFNINIIEEHHANIERESLTYLHSLSDGNYDFLQNQECGMRFFFFLSTQYVRTKNMQEALLSAANAKPILKDTTSRTINVISMIAANAIAIQMSLLYDKCLFQMLINDTDTSFITGDQPVINIKYDNINEKTGYANNVEFYYPISPKIALLIDPEFGAFRCEKTSVTEDEVKGCNALIFANSHEQVYAEDEKHLCR